MKKVKRFSWRTVGSVILILMLALATTACGDRQDDVVSATATQSPGTENAVVESTSATSPSSSPAASAYPVSRAATATPIEAGAAYPPPPPPTLTPITSYPVETATPTGVLLALDRPLEAGDTTISGVGPAGLEISIVNITLMMPDVGTTVINDDGTFEVSVDPLPAGVRIGLSADVEASTIEEEVRPAEGAINVPQIGYFYDSFVIPSGP